MTLKVLQNWHESLLLQSSKLLSENLTGYEDPKIMYMVVFGVILGKGAAVFCRIINSEMSHN